LRIFFIDLYPFAHIILPIEAHRSHRADASQAIWEIDMNAPLRHRRPDPAHVARERIALLVAIHGDRIEDAVMTDFAVEAFAAGRPAFYSTASYHSGRAICLCNTANRTGDLVEALHQEYALGAPGREYGLNALVPLNDEAVGDLLGAYQSIGTWRDWDELEARRTRKAVEKV
jgi:hypothetical protein